MSGVTFVTSVTAGTTPPSIESAAPHTVDVGG
jgi:hypothetical protein